MNDPVEVLVWNKRASRGCGALQKEEEWEERRETEREIERESERERDRERVNGRVEDRSMQSAPARQEQLLVVRE